jgi:hypothetical protein
MCMFFSLYPSGRYRSTMLRSLKLYVCMYVCMYVNKSVCMCVCSSLRIHRAGIALLCCGPWSTVCMYVCMYVYTYVCMHVCSSHSYSSGRYRSTMLRSLVHCKHTTHTYHTYQHMCIHRYSVYTDTYPIHGRFCSAESSLLECVYHCTLIHTSI